MESADRVCVSARTPPMPMKLDEVLEGPGSGYGTEDDIPIQRCGQFGYGDSETVENEFQTRKIVKPPRKVKSWCKVSALGSFTAICSMVHLLFYVHVIILSASAYEQGKTGLACAAISLQHHSVFLTVFSLWRNHRLERTLGYLRAEIDET